jgi:hypothetical protein
MLAGNCGACNETKCTSEGVSHPQVRPQKEGTIENGVLTCAVSRCGAFAVAENVSGQPHRRCNQLYARGALVIFLRPHRVNVPIHR